VPEVDVSPLPVILERIRRGECPASERILEHRQGSGVDFALR
jgi:hypothetical protein